MVQYQSVLRATDFSSTPVVYSMTATVMSIMRWFSSPIKGAWDGKSRTHGALIGVWVGLRGLRMGITVGFVIWQCRRGFDNFGKV